MKPGQIRSNGLFIPATNPETGYPNDINGIATMLAEFGVASHVISTQSPEQKHYEPVDLLPYDFKCEPSLGHVSYADMSETAEVMGYPGSLLGKLWSKIARLDQQILSGLSVEYRSARYSRLYGRMASLDMAASRLSHENPMISIQDSTGSPRPYGQHPLPKNSSQRALLQLDANKLYALLSGPDYFIGQRADELGELHLNRVITALREKQKPSEVES